MHIVDHQSLYRKHAKIGGRRWNFSLPGRDVF